jgi:hypothetical protein
MRIPIPLLKSLIWVYISLGVLIILAIAFALFVWPLFSPDRALPTDSLDLMEKILLCWGLFLLPFLKIAQSYLKKHHHKTAMSSPQSSIWRDAPELVIPDLPALLCDSRDLWLCYAVAPTDSERYAVVQFIHVIDHRLSPINDEGLGQHPYFRAGLRHYTFNEITGSAETIKWAVLKARHWAVTFKDNTLDVIAEDARVVATELQASNPAAALLDFLRRTEA